MANIIKENSDGCYLKLNDPLTLQNIQGLRDDIDNAIEQVKELRIDHEECREFDLSYLQLLISAKKTATAKNKNIRLKCKNPEPLVSLAKYSGFPSVLSWLADEDGVQYAG